MSELKTLKEIKQCGTCCVEDQVDSCIHDEVREEGIKWINNYKKELANPLISKIMFSHIEGRITGLMIFLDIKDTDLIKSPQTKLDLNSEEDVQ